VVIGYAIGKLDAGRHISRFHKSLLPEDRKQFDKIVHEASVRAEEAGK
jgi:hypothetical protein